MFPYHPLLTSIELNNVTYLATRHYETIAIIIITTRIAKSYNLDNTGLPMSPISALQFVPGEYL